MYHSVCNKYRKLTKTKTSYTFKKGLTLFLFTVTVVMNIIK